MSNLSKIIVVVAFLSINALAYWGGTMSGRSQRPVVAVATSTTPSAKPPSVPPTPTIPAVQDLTALDFVRRDSDGRKIYPCADPTEICEHLSDIGCSTGRLRSCRDTMSKLGEDVCLKLYETKYATQVHALGVTCNP